MQRVLPEPSTTDEVIPIQIDDRTLDGLNERWPLSRLTWARIIRKLTSYGPAAISIDAYFPQPGQSICTDALDRARERVDAMACDDKASVLQTIDGDMAALDDDRQFAKAIEEAGNVVLGGVLPAEKANELLAKEYDWVTKQPLPFTPSEPLRLSRDTLLTSINDIGVTGRYLGLLNMLREQDGVTRRYPYIAQWNNQTYASQALAAVMTAYPQRADALIERVASMDRGAPLLRLPPPHEPLSLIDLMNSNASPERRLRGSILIVGVTAIGTPELVTLPLRNSTVYGLEIHSMAAINLLEDSYYHSEGAPAWLGGAATTLLLALLFVACGYVDTRWLGFHALGVVVVYLVLYYAALVTMGWLITVVPVLGGAFSLFATEASYRTFQLQKRKRELLEKERINAAKSEFIATVSHELRTPLTSIRGSLGLVTAGAMGEVPDSANQMIHIAHSNAERLIRLVNNLLDLQKLEAGKMELKFSDVELGALLEETIAANQAYADEFEVAVSQECKRAVHVRGDRDLLIQSVTNLLSNAIKFSPKGETVSVTVTTRTIEKPVRKSRAGASDSRETMARIAVRDRGPGIPEEFRKRLFTRFAQASTSSDHPKGTGLGLSIVKSIVAEHGGEVDCDSEPGEGSTFYIDLPVIEQIRGSATGATLEPGGSPGGSTATPRTKDQAGRPEDRPERSGSSSAPER